MFKKVPQIGHDVKTEKDSFNWVWVIVGVIVLVAAAVAFSIASSSESNEITVSDVTASGKVLTEFSPEIINNDPAIGETAPSLAGVSFDGTPVIIDPDDNKPKVIAFLAHWCGVCQKEVPILVDWYENGGNVDGVDIYGVSTNVDRVKGNFPPGEWLQGEGWPFPTLVDSKNNIAGSTYGLTGFPYFVAVDSNGKIVARTGGDIGAAGFEALINAAKTGEPTVVIPESATKATPAEK